MRRSKKEDSITTFLGTDACIEGTIRFSGTIRLDGSVRGKIESEGGTVIIGEKAVIDADIQVDNAIIMGKVTGFIDARNRIEVYPPATVMGDIQAPTISIDAGVKFNGNCSMKAMHNRTADGALRSDDSLPIIEDSKVKNFPKNL
ncbi:MAG: bactofilin family protein [Thermodesulfobacteriota bacterium]